MKECYAREPLKVENEIPVFSTTNDYIDNYDKISKIHVDSLISTGQNPFMKEDNWLEMENDTLSLINKCTSKNQPCKILDVGVGLGRLLSYLPDNFEKYGMDISLHYLKMSREKKIEVCCSMIEDMPYKDDYFDIIVSTDVLEHVLDLNLAIKNIMRVLKPGGRLVLRVPYKEDLKSYLSPSCEFKFVHLRNFDENTLTMIFEKIFPCKVECYSFTGYVTECSKLKFRGPEFLKRLFILFVRRFRIVPSLFRKILVFCFDPCEINMLVKKP